MMHPTHFFRLSLLLTAIAIVSSCGAGKLPAGDGQPSLHEAIDRLIARNQVDFEKTAAPLADDSEFLRRIYLDLTGSIPTPAEIRAFLADTSAGKRAALAKKLLDSPAFARRMTDFFDVYLIERRQDKDIPRAQWRQYLQESFAGRKPLDVLIREILAADGADPKLRPAAKFYLDREADSHLLTRDISRLFLGRNIQCAQCHDHPQVEDYRQEHYYGILAFLNRTAIYPDKKGKRVLGEKAEGEVSYQSVFDPTKTTKSSGPRIPGRPAVAEPKLQKGKEYVVAPGKGARPVPQFSRRAQLAVQLANPDNAAFRRNLANRLWAMFLGRGLVHPLDFDHPNNPPSHPELLALLGDQLQAMKFDVRSFVGELVLSRTYQRSSRVPAGREMPVESFAYGILKPLTPEQLAWTMMQATGLIDAQRRSLGPKAGEEKVLASLQANLTPFVASFGSAPGQPEGQSFQATLDQALFVSNGSIIRGWLQPRPDNLIDRLNKIQDNRAAVEEAYLSILTRLPESEEYTELTAYLNSHKQNKQAAWQELAWAMLASVENRFNH